MARAPAFEVEGDLVDLAVGLVQLQLGGQFDMVEHGTVQQVLQPGLVMAVEEGEVQHLVGVLAVGVGVARQRDLVLRQRAGLVGAQDVHRAEVLDRVQALDDDLLARQQHRALGQRAGDDHRQHLGRQADGHRQCEQEGLQPVVLGEAVDDEDDRHHHSGKADQQPADAVDTGLEGVGRAVAGCVGGGGMRRQRAEEAAAAGRHHQRGGRARDDIGAHEHQVGLIERARACRCTGGGSWGALHELLDWHRLTGHRRLRNEQVAGAQHAAVGRDHVTGRQADDVARDQVAQRDLLRRGLRGRGGRCLRGRRARAAADHRGGVADHRTQALGGAVRAALLHEADHGAQHHHGGDHHRGLGVRTQIGQCGQCRQQQVERIQIAAPQVQPGRQWRLVLDVVGAVAGQAAGRLGGVQPVGLRLQQRQR